jgi:hypothetical protein
MFYRRSGARFDLSVFYGIGEEGDRFIWSQSNFMTMATVKVSKKTYRTLNEIAGQLRARLRRPVSVDEAIEFVMKKGRLRPSDFAGSLSMTDEEQAQILKGLEEFWSKWKFRNE